MRLDYKIGQFLSDNHVLMNYIHGMNNELLGVVVGLRGNDRDNPKVGFALFAENDKDFLRRGCIVTTPNKITELKDKLAEIRACVVNNEKALKYFNEFVNNYEIEYNEYRPNRELVYKTIVLAYRRANTNRDTYYVCEDENLLQNGTSFKPYSLEDDEDIESYYIHGKYFRNNDIIFDSKYEPDIAQFYYLQTEENMRRIRKAIRAMEWRCWKYFKDWY